MDRAAELKAKLAGCEAASKNWKKKQRKKLSKLFQVRGRPPLACVLLLR